MYRNTTVCPKIRPSRDVPAPISSDQVRFGSDERVSPVPVPSAVTDLDRRSTEALTTGWVELGPGRVHAAVWFRLLRTVVDEVSSPLVRTGRWATRLVAIWRAAGRSRPLRTAWVPFEDLHWDEQATVLVILGDMQAARYSSVKKDLEPEC